VSSPALLRTLFAALSAGIVVLDQVTKAMVVERLPLYHSISVVQGFFALTHVRNTGAAFGIFASVASPWRGVFLNAVALGVFVAVLVWSLRTPPSAVRLQTGLALILGGAVGNLIDRFRLGSVIDFLLFHIGRYEWPSFNVADSSITVGVFLLAWVLWTESPASEAPAPR
jgi:signal peptidase II